MSSSNFPTEIGLVGIEIGLIGIVKAHFQIMSVTKIEIKKLKVETRIKIQILSSKSTNLNATYNQFN